MRLRPDARQQQQLGRIDRGCGDDHLARGGDGDDLALLFQLYPGCAAVFDDDAASKALLDLDPTGLDRGFQIGIGGGPALPLPDRRLHRAKAFLLLPVVIGRHGIAGLTARFDEGIEQRVLPRAAGDVQRTVGTTERRIARIAMPAFHTLEIGQHIGIGPTIGALFGPMVKVTRMAAHIDHAVDRGRPANHLAARGGQNAAPQMRLGFGLKAPVVDPHVHGIGQRARHLDERPRIGTAEFDDGDAAPGFGQTIGHGAPGRACADNDVFACHQ